MEATDLDEGDNGLVRFSFENSTLTGGEAAFSVSAETGALRQRRPLPARLVRAVRPGGGFSGERRPDSQLAGCGHRAGPAQERPAAQVGRRL